jgi:hypothetical protein
VFYEFLWISCLEHQNLQLDRILGLVGWLGKVIFLMSVMIYQILKQTKRICPLNMIVSNFKWRESSVVGVLF